MKYLLFLKHIFEEPHEKSHKKIFKSNAPLVPALAQTRDFLGLMVQPNHQFDDNLLFND